jgi:two-component system nitrogen regulation response regulator GlnG
MALPNSILIIDDEASICAAFRRFFEDRGWTARAAASAETGLAAFLEHRPDVVFLDVRLPDRSGLDLLNDLAGLGANVVVITAYGGLETVVRAIQGKAADYLPKPLDLDKALALAQRFRGSEEAAPHAGASRTSDESQLLIGNSPPMQEVYKLIARASVSSSPVLIEGATGTGKELAALAIHRFGARSSGPFVAINCGAIPANLIESELFVNVRGAFTGADSDRPGRFEAADHGTLLLDEIGELTRDAQVKLLRVLDSGIIERVGSSKEIKLDVRILAATNRALAEEVRRGLFRQDLYYRLAVLHITLPPLRERKEDILPLAMHFLAQRPARSGAQPSLSERAVEALLRHEWPGNVREIKNAMEHAASVAPNRAIMPEDLPESVRRGDAGFPNGEIGGPADEEAFGRLSVEYAAGLSDGGAGRYHRAVESLQRSLLAYALKRSKGNQSEAADYLGLHRNTLRNMLRDQNMKSDEDPKAT